MHLFVSRSDCFKQHAEDGAPYRPARPPPLPLPHCSGGRGFQRAVRCADSNFRCSLYRRAFLVIHALLAVYQRRLSDVYARWSDDPDSGRLQYEYRSSPSCVARPTSFESRCSQESNRIGTVLNSFRLIDSMSQTACFLLVPPFMTQRCERGALSHHLSMQVMMYSQLTFHRATTAADLVGDRFRCEASPKQCDVGR